MTRGQMQVSGVVDTDTGTTHENHIVDVGTPVGGGEMAGGRDDVAVRDVGMVVGGVEVAVAGGVADDRGAARPRP